MADQEAEERRERHKRNRQRAIDEILTSEQRYVQSLSVLCSSFIHPLRAFSKDSSQVSLP